MMQFDPTGPGPGSPVGTQPAMAVKMADTVLGKLVGTIKRFIDTLNKTNKEAEKTKKFFDGITKVVGVIKKLPGMEVLTSIFDKMLNVTMGAGLTAFFEALERIGDIIGIVFMVLKPFLMILSIIANVLEAALAPMMAYIYEKMQPVIQGLVESIPRITEAVMELIENDTGLADAIINLIDLLPALIDGLIEIVPLIFDLAITFARDMLPALILLIPLMVKLAIDFGKELLKILPKILPELFGLTKAFLDIFLILKDLVPILGPFIRVMSTFLMAIMGAWIGIQMGNPYVALALMMAGLAFDIGRNIASAQEGGIFTEPGLVMIDNPPEKITPLDDVDSSGGITININAPVYGNDEFVDYLTNEIQKRKQLGLI